MTFEIPEVQEVEEERSGGRGRGKDSGGTHHQGWFKYLVFIGYNDTKFFLRFLYLMSLLFFIFEVKGYNKNWERKGWF